MSSDLPDGTVTFLFTDVEGSTRLWEQHPDGMPVALARHDELVRRAVEANGGHVVKTTGDGCYAVFRTAEDGLTAALTAQQALYAEAWQPIQPDAIRARMALHTGEAELRDGDYFGPALNRTARLLSIGHGGQVLLSTVTAELVRDRVPTAVDLRDLGEHRLKDLTRPERIFQLLAPTLPLDFPPLRVTDAAPNNLPAQLTPFIGREHEVAQVRKLLSQHRLVTLTGSGGVGKTRLAIELATTFATTRGPAFANGIWLVQFAPIADPVLVPHAVATALGLPTQPGQTYSQLLVTYLADKDMLLLLDNCEHLISACAELAETLLRACPRLHVLATSREPLGVSGEVTWPVLPLRTPDPAQLPPLEQVRGYEAIQLFVEHATAVRPSFELTAANANVVAQICHRLDGIPLAIEMAAAHVAALAVHEIAASLDQRFAVLISGSHSALPHHRTLRAVLEWSYALLSEAEKALLAELSVFVGSWTVAAARAVCSGGVETLPLLVRLVRKSLVVAEPRDESPEGETRYHLLETTRLYGAEQLGSSGQADAIRRRHAEYYASLLNTSSSVTGEAQNAAWHRQLERHYSDMRAALAWCYGAAGDAVLGLRIATALGAFWNLRGWFSHVPGWLGEGRALLERAIAQTPDAPRPLRAHALFWLGSLVVTQRDMRRARALGEEALTLFREDGDKPAIIYVLYGLARIAQSEGNTEQVELRLEEMIAVTRTTGETNDTAAALAYAGWVWLDQGDYSRAQTALEESLRLWRQTGVKWSTHGGVARTALWLGRATQLQGDLSRASGLLEESLTLYREAGDKNGVAWSLAYLGEIALSTGDVPKAAEHFKESLKPFQEIEDSLGVATALAGLAEVERLRSHPQRAARLTGAAAAIGEREGGRWLPKSATRILFDRVLMTTGVQAAYTEANLAAAWVEGQQMTLDQAMAYALQGSEAEADEAPVR